MNKRFAIPPHVVILPLITVSLLGMGSLPAQANPAEAKADILSKLEYCQQFDTQLQRRRCRQQVREYCVEKYPKEFCKKVFQMFKDAQGDESASADLPKRRVD